MTVNYQGNTVSNEDLRNALEQLSNTTGQTVTVHSGDRDPASNSDANGSSRSLHLDGSAADISIGNMTTREASEAAARSGLFDGVGNYDGSESYGAHAHVDLGRTRPDGSGRRWSVNTGNQTTGWFDQSNINQPPTNDPGNS